MTNVRSIKNHFLNSLIKCGRKLSAEKFLLSVLVQLKLRSDLSPYDIFYYSTLNLRPLVFLRPLKVGSTVYRTPAPITNHKRRLYAIAFILGAVKDSRGSITVERTQDLFMSIYNASKNAAFDKKVIMYEEAMSNRSFIRRLKYSLY